MSRPSETAQLKQVPRFANLSKRELKAVAEAGTFVHLPANWALMSETTPADKAYVILSGEVAIRHHGETVATVGAGDIIGEVGVLEKRLRTASVVSMTELQVVHFTNEHLTELIDQIPALGEALRATAQAHKDADEARKGSSAPQD
ncbi:MAG: cyclic nucleotide-binding domain-containing protein [Nocardioides sp.]